MDVGCGSGLRLTVSPALGGLGCRHRHMPFYVRHGEQRYCAFGYGHDYELVLCGAGIFIDLYTYDFADAILQLLLIHKLAKTQLRLKLNISILVCSD